MDELIKIEKQLLDDGLTPTVNARDLHEFLEVKSRFNDWIANRINNYGFAENQDFTTLTKNLVSGGKVTEYFISIDMAKELSMVERNDKGKEARRYFIECEKRAREKTIALPDFSNPVLAARAWADQCEQRLLVEQQRDIAIATKAEIGSRREATSMATASREKRRAERLEIELDQSRQYATIKRMEKVHHGLKFNWRALKSTSKEMGLPPIDVFDPNFETVKAYHRDVWMETYALGFEDGE